MESCKYCNSDSLSVVPRPDTPHTGGELKCNDCNRHLMWMPAPGTEDKRRSKHPLASELGINSCQLCLKTKEELPDNRVLDVHHLDKNYENNDPKNLIVVCTACHKMIHWLQCYTTNPIKFGFLNDEK